MLLFLSIYLLTLDIDRASWLKMLADLNLREVELRDARYDCVIHLVSAAKGAEKFYSTADHTVRSEGIPLAREIDDRIRNAWLGHPYMDVIDNSTGFDEKLRRVVEAVCKRLGVRDNRARNVIKRKFYVSSWPQVSMIGKKKNKKKVLVLVVIYYYLFPNSLLLFFVVVFLGF